MNIFGNNINKNKNKNKNTKPNVANSNNLLNDQMNTKTQLNDILNKAMAAVQVSPETQRQQIQSDLQEKYLKAQTNMQTAPLELEKSKKDYYVFKSGEANYNTMREDELKQKAEQIKQQIANKFSEETSNAKTMNSYYNTQIINSGNSNELYEEYVKKNAVLEKTIKNSHGDVLTNDRKTYYENEAIDTAKLWHKFLMICYYILLVAYVISIFVSDTEMSRVKQFTILIALVLYPFIIDAIVKWVLTNYTTLQEDASRNVYLNL
jgi:hypothetical protein